jgi:hypothetical protein
MRKLVVIAPALLAACATAEPQTAAAPADQPQKCQPEGANAFVGKFRSPELEAQIVQATHAKFVRWVDPGMMVTMDYREDRITVQLGPDHRIIELHCG